MNKFIYSAPLSLTMVLKESIRKAILLQREEIVSRDPGIPRDILRSIDLSLPHAHILSGIRRAGKSTLLLQLLRKRENAYYINFEDQRILGFKVSDFSKLDEVFSEEFGKSRYYFFDEIQNVPSWEVAVRRLLDAGKRCVITGSNASLLSRELGTRLTGRHLSLELFPFGYSETLRFSKKTPSRETFESYSRTGGFPEYLKYGRTEILQELLSGIVERDVAMRHSIEASRRVTEIAVYMLSNVGKLFSYTKLASTFEVTTATMISYLSHLEDSYLIFTVPKFSYSLRKQKINPKKVYGIDVGLCRANSLSFSEDKGRILENLVFLHLRRQFDEIYYFNEKRECDFIVRDRKKGMAAYQVCYEINDDNKKREIGGLKEAMETLKITKGMVITFDQEDVVGGIPLVPAWKWMRS